MNRETTEPAAPDKILRVEWPDLRRFSSPLLRRPFSLWRVGDLAMVHHWLDHAMDRAFDEVQFYFNSEDERGTIEKTLSDQLLWPVECKCLLSADLRKDLPHAVAWGIPQYNHRAEVQSCWDLARHWRDVEMHWLKAVVPGRPSDLIINNGMGRRSSIHPTVEIEGPVWIGDHVKIGANSVIGPNVVIDDGCVLEGGNTLSDVRLEKGTYLARDLDIHHSILAQNRVISLEKETFKQDYTYMLCGSVSSPFVFQPSLKERREAMVLWMKAKLRIRNTRYPAASLTTREAANGLSFPWLQGDNILAQRLLLLREVMKGKLFLYGILPREHSQWEAMEKNLANLLRQAPTGVYSLADVHGVHDSCDPRELDFAIRQATLMPRSYVPRCRDWARHLHSGHYTSLSV